MEGRKYCTDCGKTKPISEFWKNRSMRDGLQHYCKGCWYARTRVYQQRNRERTLYLRRNGNLKRKYGLTVEEFDQLAANGCNICGANVKARGKRLHVDHDHDSGAVRGVLCHWCNIMLGNARDDPVILRWGATYLERTRTEG